MRKDVRWMRRQRPQGWGSLLLAVLLLLVLAPMVAHAQADSVSLAWTAPGDDGAVGTAASYELRMSTSPITSSNWSGATIVAGAPGPAPAGTLQSAVVHNLTSGTVYWFALKTTDDVGNQSLISNVVRWDWQLDTAPPSAPTGITAVKQIDGSARVAWAANSEPDLAGYNVYRALSASGPYTALNGSLLSATQYVDSGIPAGTETVWYQVSAKDASNNESARSTIMLSLVVDLSVWAMETGYPNPSSAGTTVRLPLVVPSAGGQATLEIVNSTGQRVRWIDMGTLTSGAVVAQWDGRNDAGREVAPGVYTVWLITGATRVSVRLVRVP
jgi:flagellar hook capping protein FlgD